MEWGQVLTLVGSNIALMSVSIGSTIGLFLWTRSEARSDQEEIRDIIRAIQEEMKDFHGKLCAIEERNRGK